MGNITAVIRKRTLTSAGRAIVVDLTLSNSYATNGDVLPSNAALGLGNSLDLLDLSGGASGYLLEVDHTNRKIKAYRQTAATSALVEVPNATDLSAVTVRGVVHGDMPNV